MRAVPPVLVALLLLGGCDDMIHQPKHDAYTDARTGPGKVPRATVPFREAAAPAPPVTQALLERGQVEHRAFCAPCHAETGDGRGMVVQRGFPAAPSYHDARLREASPQHLYDVVTNGVGVMYGFAQRVRPADRWAIVAYIRALQRSQDATPADLPPAQREALK